MVKILFVCTHNSARSQIAEAYLKQMAGEHFQVESAGFEPADLNPLAIEVMAEEGIDISHKKTQSVFNLYKTGKLYDYVITVCENGREAECPVFPGISKRLHMPFDDPSALSGGKEERLAKIRRIRDQIKDAVNKLVLELD
ncbi:arsenate reductase ArsC [Dethiosulfatarculus sandiegensis]|uniref:Arsenate reductase n=1 Tax=Dethiosulfatarculus sandiegensis TaxID=1429043 RepID=A0A0D2J942_9BACT|nr:arsenate reductase ArsC [Dethiosulfatarculus sandiegensis]KIX14684.1 arsenate reductase [Dethiosulfatarculus sandiegensis]